MKVHLRIFVEMENLGKAMNALAAAGITGFYILEYKGMSPDDWKGFSIKEDPKSAIGMIHKFATQAILICSVVDERDVDRMTELIVDELEGEKYTILQVPIRKIIIGSNKKNKSKE